MAERAHVSSVEALESFRSSLIVYLSKARPALEEISTELTRVKLWLENEQRAKLEAQLRRQMKVLEQAQAALFSARVSNLRQENTAELLAVQKARRAVEETEQKLRMVKKWSREFESHVDPLVRDLTKLHNFLTTDMAGAVAYLAQAVKTLDAYAGLAPPSAPSSPASPTSPRPADTQAAQTGSATDAPASQPGSASSNSGNPP
jgi:hypothetical protein